MEDVRSKFTESYARQNQMVSLMDKLIAKKGNAALIEKQQNIKNELAKISLVGSAGSSLSGATPLAKAIPASPVVSMSLRTPTASPIPLTAPSSTSASRSLSSAALRPGEQLHAASTPAASVPTTPKPTSTAKKRLFTESLTSAAPSPSKPAPVSAPVSKPMTPSSKLAPPKTKASAVETARRSTGTSASAPGSPAGRSGISSTTTAASALRLSLSKPAADARASSRSDLLASLPPTPTKPATAPATSTPTPTAVTKPFPVESGASRPATLSSASTPIKNILGRETLLSRTPQMPPSSAASAATTAPPTPNFQLSLAASLATSPMPSPQEQKPRPVDTQHLRASSTRAAASQPAAPTTPKFTLSLAPSLASSPTPSQPTEITSSSTQFRQLQQRLSTMEKALAELHTKYLRELKRNIVLEELLAAAEADKLELIHSCLSILQKAQTADPQVDEDDEISFRKPAALASIASHLHKPTESETAVHTNDDLLNSMDLNVELGS